MGTVAGIPLNARGQYAAMLTCVACLHIVEKRQRLWSTRLEERVAKLGLLQTQLGQIRSTFAVQQKNFNSVLQRIRDEESAATVADTFLL
jgi:hypothetical protein